MDYKLPSPLGPCVFRYYERVQNLQTRRRGEAMYYCGRITDLVSSRIPATAIATSQTGWRLVYTRARHEMVSSRVDSTLLISALTGVGLRSFRARFKNLGGYK